MPHDWRPPTDADWRRLRTLLRDVLVHLEGGSYQRQVELDDRGMFPGTLAP